MENKPEPLARLYRPMPANFFPSDNIIAMYDDKKEIVYYNWDVWPTLTKEEQHKVYTLHTKYLER
jgi:hypothetical protein